MLEKQALIHVAIKNLRIMCITISMMEIVSAETNAKTKEALNFATV